jgi:uncharacterized protein YndB with AHSA1/START domain
MTTTNPLTVKAQGDREILITRSFDAPRALVFRALTEPDLVRRWLLGPPGWTMPVCEIDLKVGGRFRYEWQKADGARMAMGGVYREIEAPFRLVCTEIFDEDWTGGEAVSTIVLTEERGRTCMVNTVVYSSPEARDAVLETPMEEGMAAGYDKLDEVLASLA